MTTPSVLISGGSIAGLSVAFWLRRAGWDVTVVERAPNFRTGGQNVDVRGVAHEVLDRMGLTAAVRDLHTTETGTVFVDGEGRVETELPTDEGDGATAELEILRGDFAQVIADHLPDGVRFRYDETITAVVEENDRVRVTLRSGHVLEVDLLVIAEGVRSTTRELLFGDAVHRRELGVAMVFGTIPRTAADDDRWRWYTTTEGRQVHLRPDNHGTTRAILAYTCEDDPTSLDQTESLTRLRERFADAGWEAPRVLDGFAASDDVYVDFLTQIQLDRWHQGRVCVIGDAAWCVTPMGGGGSSLALTSGYVLGAFLSAVPRPTTSLEVEGALARYETWMRPLTESAQRLPESAIRMAYPQTRLGLRLRDLAMKALTAPPLSKVTSSLGHVAETDQPLPDVQFP